MQNIIINQSCRFQQKSSVLFVEINTEQQEHDNDLGSRGWYQAASCGSSKGIPFNVVIFRNESCLQTDQL